MSEHNSNLKNTRKEYSLSELNENSIPQNPIKLFDLWLKIAFDKNVNEPNAMTISTCDLNGQPSSRIVLLRNVEDGNFIFFTNYESKKGKTVALNPKVALNFFWPELEKQVRIEGLITKYSGTKSDEYFNSRPYLSQIGAIASQQSEELESRATLENKIDELIIKYPEGQLIQRPEYWGGYEIKPNYIEFWQGRIGRLHDRISYSLENENWSTKRLNP